jgi:hypothetical protein
MMGQVFQHQILPNLYQTFTNIFTKRLDNVRFMHPLILI